MSMENYANTVNSWCTGLVDLPSVNESFVGNKFEMSIGLWMVRFDKPLLPGLCPPINRVKPLIFGRR